MQYTYIYLDILYIYIYITIFINRKYAYLRYDNSRYIVLFRNL